MVESLNIPKDLTKLFELEVKDNSEPLRRFLTDLVNRIDIIEEDNKKIKDKLGIK